MIKFCENCGKVPVRCIKCMKIGTFENEIVADAKKHTGFCIYPVCFICVSKQKKDCEDALINFGDEMVHCAKCNWRGETNALKRSKKKPNNLNKCRCPECKSKKWSLLDDE
jgi:hypothetical protein